MEYMEKRAVKAFVPSNWTGINGIEPLKLNWLTTLPARKKPRARPINPRLYECTETEFRRLCGYFYKSSRSPWASCLVVVYPNPRIKRLVPKSYVPPAERPVEEADEEANDL